MISTPVTTIRQTFGDEFDALSSSPDGSLGTWRTTYPYGGEAARTLPDNHEAEYYSDSSVGENPFSVSSGILSITATPAAPGSNPYNLPFDSGLITTDSSFSQLYGYFEVSAELPAQQGLWPAFWMLPSSNAYTAELDVFEAIDAQPNTIYATVHGTTNGSWGAETRAITVPNIATGFNTYGVDWEPTVTTFYVNGVAVASEATPGSMNVPMFMLLNLAVGGPGSWPGPPDSSTHFPASMQIDYVRAYATAGTLYVGGSAALPQAPPQNPDTLTLRMSEDAWKGDAEFTVSVDNKQVGGIQTASALHTTQDSNVFSLTGNWGQGTHSVQINFINDAYAGTPQTDRNLYVDSIAMNGVTFRDTQQPMFAGGAMTFQIGGTIQAIASPADVVTVKLAEDAWKGDAQFTLSVDGKAITTPQAVTALHNAGAWERFTIAGNFGPGSHTIGVSFVNDAYAGTPDTDRNLYVDGMNVNGQDYGAKMSLMSNWTASFPILTTH